jgi:hypothetical protein
LRKLALTSAGVGGGGGISTIAALIDDSEVSQFFNFLDLSLFVVIHCSFPEYKNTGTYIN